MRDVVIAGFVVIRTVEGLPKFVLVTTITLLNARMGGSI